ncbi:MAG: efflux RND transporter periplasmic adaptor subunit [Deltaproteobacteria bacterium]|nr:efflux RND transporter periplasmic adaptor subunit [Deltaproteobacteria bacterium]MBW2419763.1 efflux RND transporter periplasmic adaptor subunit [Deltaproteobacteria bacterium]
MRAYLLVIALLAAIFASIAGYRAIRSSAMAGGDFAPPPVTVAAAVARQEIQKAYLDAVGTIKAIRGIDLSSESSGQITALHFDSGDAVAEGQLLLVLNDEVEQASRRNQIASRELAEILFERDRQLIQQKSIAQSQLDRSKADFERARAQLAETEARLRNRRIHAPFAGTLGIRRVDLGDYLSPGTLIASLQDLSALEIDFTVPARFAPQLQVGQEIAFGVTAFPGRSFTAKLAAIDARVDPGTRSLLLRARIAEPGNLLPGMFASLRMDLGADRPVVTVPETAVTYALQGTAVYVIEPGEEGSLTATSRIVEVGEVRDGRASILDGLGVGERIVTVGQNKLYRGVRVVIDESVQL